MIKKFVENSVSKMATKSSIYVKNKKKSINIRSLK